MTLRAANMLAVCFPFRLASCPWKQELQNTSISTMEKKEMPLCYLMHSNHCAAEGFCMGQPCLYTILNITVPFWEEKSALYDI